MKILNKITRNPVGRYFREAKEELAKVTWPTKAQTKNYTVLVIAVSVALAVFLGVMDHVFNLILERII